MTTFDKREEAFEKKFALDEEQKFKAIARRNRLLGLWVADQLGLSGDVGVDYAKTVVAAEFGEGRQRRRAQRRRTPRQDERADGGSDRPGEGGRVSGRLLLFHA
jgi:hypothetical protein